MAAIRQPIIELPCKWLGGQWENSDIGSSSLLWIDRKVFSIIKRKKAACVYFTNSKAFFTINFLSCTFSKL